jgi:hypothetical protein
VLLVLILIDLLVFFTLGLVFTVRMLLLLIGILCIRI